jgi:hypothetical protein
MVQNLRKIYLDTGVDVGRNVGGELGGSVTDCTDGGNVLVGRAVA